MSFVLPLLMTLLFLGIVGGGGMEGLWSNVLRFLNVCFAAFIALSYFEWVASLIEGFLPATHFHADMAALGLLFGVSMLIFRTITDKASKIKIKFLPAVDKAGGFIVAAMTGYIVVGIIVIVLHTAPLGGREYFFEGFKPTAGLLLGSHPDQMVLGRLASMSEGSLGRTFEPIPFDPKSEFIEMHADRREKYEKLKGLFVSGSGK